MKNTWKRKFTGLFLILGALSLLAVGVFFQYQSVRASTAWHQFVKEAIPRVLQSNYRLDLGEAVLENAKAAGLDNEALRDLEAEIIAARPLLTEAATVDEYIVPIANDGTELDLESRDFVATPQSSSLADLDIFSEAQSGTMYKVIEPPRVKGHLKRYRTVFNDLSATLKRMEVAADEVEEALEGDIGDALHALRASAELLREASVRASIFLTYTEERAAGSEEWVALEEALEESSTLLGEVQEVDRESLREMHELTKKLDAHALIVDEVAVALADSLGEVYEEVLETIPPEELWEGGLDWLEAEVIAPIPVLPDPGTSPGGSSGGGSSSSSGGGSSSGGSQGGTGQGSGSGGQGSGGDRPTPPEGGGDGDGDGDGGEENGGEGNPDEEGV